MDEDLYTVSETQKMQFAGIYLLEYMAGQDKTFPLLLSSNEEDLEPILEWLLVRKHVGIVRNDHYAVTDHGRQALGKFAKRYSEYLRNFDIYSAVDLGTGEFAFAHYYEHKDDDAWKRFLDNDRWEDLRVAVADYKDMDPVELVFMSFLNERRFGRDARGWQFDLLLGTVWEEILDVCNNALDIDDLAYETDDGEFVEGESVIRDVISQGAAVLVDIFEQEEKQHRREGWDDGSFGGEPLRSEEKDFDPRRYEDPNYRPPDMRDRWSM